jgi:hypothetical protein
MVNSIETEKLNTPIFLTCWIIKIYLGLIL